MLKRSKSSIFKRHDWWNSIVKRWSTLQTSRSATSHIFHTHNVRTKVFSSKHHIIVIKPDERSNDFNSVRLYSRLSRKNHRVYQRKYLFCGNDMQLGPQYETSEWWWNSSKAAGAFSKCGRSDPSVADLYLLTWNVALCYLVCKCLPYFFCPTATPGNSTMSLI